MRILIALLCLISCLPAAAPAATTAAQVAAAAPAVKDPLGCKLIKASAYAYGIDKTGPITDATLPALLGEPGEGFGGLSAGTDSQDGGRDAAYVWHSGD